MTARDITDMERGTQSFVIPSVVMWSMYLNALVGILNSNMVSVSRGFRSETNRIEATRFICYNKFYLDLKGKRVVSRRTVL